MAAGTTVKISVPSVIGLVDLVHGAAERMAEIAGFEEEDSLSVALAVREAVINAIKHGNRSNPDLTVDVTLTADDEGIRVQVRDQGNGFDPSCAPDPTSDENRLKPSGRGLLLVRAFVDAVGFRFDQGRGMEVTLIKKRRSKRESACSRFDGPALRRRK